jgi:hypothetical protein
MRSLCGVGAVVVSCGGASAFDAAAEFSATANPNGVWSYGYTNVLAGPFNLAAFPSTVAAVDYWSPNFLGNPDISHNGTAANVDLITARGWTHWSPDDLVMRPGVNGQQAVVRWTSPIASNYAIQGSFVSADNNTATCDVYVLVNGVVLFAGNVVGPTGTTTNFGLPAVALAAGDTVDFAVGMFPGFGTGDYFYDAVSLQSPPGGLISPIPAPGTGALMAIGGVLLWRRRR